MSKFLFVSGGVCSSLGKGVIASSICRLLSSSNLKVSIRKIDPYLNITAENMDPYQHGEVFVTHDGKQVDMDLGHYERIGGVETCKSDSITAGEIYRDIVNDQNHDTLKGETVQIVPHVTNKIIDKIKSGSENYDIVICEIGGTIGDIEVATFLEAIRQMSFDNDFQCAFVMVSLIPWISQANEFKTKPTQHACRTLHSYGIKPNMIFMRSAMDVPENIAEKIKITCNVPHVFKCVDQDNIYSLIESFAKQNIHTVITDYLSINTSTIDLASIIKYNYKFNNIKQYHRDKRTIKIGISMKYISVPDAYRSLIESIRYAGIQNDVHIDIVNIDCSLIDSSCIQSNIDNIDGLIIPGGFGRGGFDGKVAYAKYAIENDIPILGICYGMQAMVIAACKIYLNIDALNREHTNEDGFYAIQELSSDILCGTKKIDIKKSSLMEKIYNASHVYERFRHRFCINPDLIDMFSNQYVSFSAYSNYNDYYCYDAFEVNNNKFALGIQYHPEFLSRPNASHPIFDYFIEVLLKKCK